MNRREALRLRVIKELKSSKDMVRLCENTSCVEVANRKYHYLHIVHACLKTLQILEQGVSFDRVYDFWLNSW